MPVHSRIVTLPLEVIIYLLRHCTVPTLSRLASACTYMDELVAFELDCRYTDVLDVFVNDLERFRLKMTELNSVVSGSAAVAVCSPRHAIRPGDLDIYSPFGLANDWAEYLRSHEGYAPEDEEGPDYSGTVDNDYHGGITLVMKLVHPDSRQRIHIVESHTASATLPIPSFWSTAVMVFLTAKGIVSLYPRLQEQHRGLITPARDNASTLNSILIPKYRDRGFDIRTNFLEWARQEDPDALCAQDKSPDCPFTVRWIGDHWTLVRALGTVLERRDCTVTEGMLATLTTVWLRGGQPCGSPCTTPDFGYVTPLVVTQPREVVD